MRMRTRRKKVRTNSNEGFTTCVHNIAKKMIDTQVGRREVRGPETERSKASKNTADGRRVTAREADSNKRKGIGRIA